MIAENPAALPGGKGFRDPNAKKTRKKRKKGRPVFRWSCESARLPGPYLAKYGEKPINPRARRCRQRAKRHRRRTGYNTKIQRLGAKSPSIGGGIVKYKHKWKKYRWPRFVRKPERNEAGRPGGLVGLHSNTTTTNNTRVGPWVK